MILKKPGFISLKFGLPSSTKTHLKATKIYHGLCVAVGAKSRGMGLGNELIKRTMDLAKNQGCSHVYVMATGIYSQRIFKNLNFQILREMAYDDFLDRDGKTPFFKNMNEHKTCQIILYEFLNNNN